MNDASAGPCILYAVSCGLSDKDLADRYDILARRGGKESLNEDEENGENNEEEEQEGSGSKFPLKAWNQRKHPNLGYEPGEEHHVEKLPLLPDLAASERGQTEGRKVPLSTLNFNGTPLAPSAHPGETPEKRLLGKRIVG
jgi:hypothetical protein